MKDHFGQDIKLGDRVVYCTSHKQYYTIGIVSEILARKIRIIVEKDKFLLKNQYILVYPTNVVILNVY